MRRKPLLNLDSLRLRGSFRFFCAWRFFFFLGSEEELLELSRALGLRLRSDLWLFFFGDLDLLRLRLDSLAPRSVW